jgi:hypothetical protein
MSTIKAVSTIEVGTYTNETLLWRAVIARAIQEWISGSLRRQRDVEQYLFGDNRHFPLVCGCAGMDSRTITVAAGSSAWPCDTKLCTCSGGVNSYRSASEGGLQIARFPMRAHAIKYLYAR